MAANCAYSSLFILAKFTLIKMLCQDIELSFEVLNFMTIIDIVKILQTEIVLFEQIVGSPSEHFVHQF